MNGAPATKSALDPSSLSARFNGERVDQRRPGTDLEKPAVSLEPDIPLDHKDFPHPSSGLIARPDWPLILVQRVQIFQVWLFRIGPTGSIARPLVPARLLTIPNVTIASIRRCYRILPRSVLDSKMKLSRVEEVAYCINGQGRQSAWRYSSSTPPFLNR